MSNDIPGLMAGLSILRMVPVIAESSKRRADRLTRIAAICLRGNMIERWYYFQMAKFSAVAGRDSEEGSPRFFQDSAGEVASLACLPGFSFTGDRLENVRSLSLDFWASCDGLLRDSGLAGSLSVVGFDAELEVSESRLLDQDEAALGGARSPVLEYTALCNVVVNDYHRRRRLASMLSQAGGWV